MVKVKSIEREKLFFGMLLILCTIINILFYDRFRNVLSDIYHHSNFSEALFTDHFWNYEGYLPFQVISYPLFHLIQKGIVVITGISYYSAAMAIILCANILTIIAIRRVGLYVLARGERRQYYILDILCVTSVFFGNIVGVLTDGRFYARQCAPNPILNPTVSATRPIGIFCFLCFSKIIYTVLSKEGCIGSKEWISYSLLLLISVLFKPSFIFVLLPAFAIATIYVMFRQKSIGFGVKTLLATFPTLIVLCFQIYVCISDLISVKLASNLNMQTMYSESSFKVQFGSFSEFTIKEVVMVTIAACFIPLLSVLLLHKEDVKEKVVHVLALCVLVAGWLQMFFLSNGPTGDFSWGYDLSVYTSTTIAMIIVLKVDCKKWVRFFFALIYTYQVICGIVFLVKAYYLMHGWF